MNCIHCEEKRRNENENSFHSQLDQLNFQIQAIYRKYFSTPEKVSLISGVVISKISEVNLHTDYSYLGELVTHLQDFNSNLARLSYLFEDENEAYMKDALKVSSLSSEIYKKIANLNPVSHEFFNIHKTVRAIGLASKIPGEITDSLRVISSPNDRKKLFNREVIEPKEIMIIKSHHIDLLKMMVTDIQKALNKDDRTDMSLKSKLNYQKKIKAEEDKILSLEIAFMLNSDTKEAKVNAHKRGDALVD